MNLLTIATLKDGTFARELLNYPNYTEALTALYMALASAIANPDCNIYVAELINDDGHVVKCEKYDKRSA